MKILRLLFFAFMVNTCTAETTKVILEPPFAMTITVVQDIFGVSVTVAIDEKEIFFQVPAIQEEPERTDIWDIVLDKNSNLGAIPIDPMDLTLTGGVSNAR